MPSSLSIGYASPELTYGRPVFDAILRGVYPDDTGVSIADRSGFICDNRGAWVKDPVLSDELAWHPASEIMAPGSPDPLSTPWLPFPFTARQLAALMTDGHGYFIQEKYGDWAAGPDADELASLGKLHGKAVEALQFAYEEHRRAAALAPKPDAELARDAQRLQAQYDQARESAMTSFGARDPGLTSEERESRLERVKAAVAEIKQRLTVADQIAEEAASRWRKAVVQFLLLPLEEVSAESFRSQILAAIPPSRRAEALEQTERHYAYMLSHEGRERWDLECALGEIEEQRSRLLAMQPESVTEESLKANRLKELAEEATLMSARLDKLNTSISPDAGATGTPANRRIGESVDVSLLASPDELCAAYGSYGLKRDWFDDLNSRKWLRNARKVIGQGQRGHRRPPLFCPLEVMTGLVAKSRKRRLSETTGWRLLEAHFPKVYGAHSAADPRDPPG